MADDIEEFAPTLPTGMVKVDRVDDDPNEELLARLREFDAHRIDYR